MKEERINCIDGIKAIAAMLVFHIHFLNAYYCGIYTLNPADFHTKAGIEWWIGATPLNIIYAGKLGARIFLTLSAFLLTRNFFRRPDKKKLLISPVKKYIHLMIPAVAVNILVYLLMRSGAYYNGKAAVLAHSEEFFGVYNQFLPNLPAAIREAAVGCFFAGDNAYNGPLWFLQYEFWGCILVAVLIGLMRNRKFWIRMLVYMLAAGILVRTDYLCMILAMALADTLQAEEMSGILRKVTERQWILWLVFSAAFYFATYPSYGSTEGTMYAIFPPKVLFYYNAAIPVLLFAILYLRPVRIFLERKSFRRFTRISYSFYLIHFPVLCTVSAALFVSMYDKMNYHILVFLTYVTALTVSAAAAWGITKWVERPAARVAGWLEGRFL